VPFSIEGWSQQKGHRNMLITVYMLWTSTMGTAVPKVTPNKAIQTWHVIFPVL
jgi:hypothetical protein